ncbi:MAG: hypothetical protein HY559_07285, partial [Gammaproteobacteria bacterium]|nr:hypothetical protein [Gammaproteobacteria bacterium]
LLDLLEIAEWVLYAHKFSPEKDDDPYCMLCQKIYSHAEEMGCNGIIELDKASGKYYPTGEYEMNGPAMKFIDDFEEDTFWEELTVRLSERDAVQKHGEKAIQEMEGIERIRALYENENKYRKEFEQQGLARIVISSKSG